MGKNTPVDTAIPGSGGGYINTQKDAKESSTAPKFGDIWQQIQSKYGAKAEKPREIKKQLGKDDFMRIMITQMKNQDPTKPFDAEQMSSQMAQFASVEQLSNMNQALNKFVTAANPTERLAMTNLIGKTVTIDRSRFPHIEGQTEALSFSLPQDAEQVAVVVKNELGEAVAEKQLGPMKKGDSTFSWDGLKANLQPAKAGTYSYEIQAVNSSGQEIMLNPQRKAKVVGVSFEGQEPVFLVGDNKQQDKVTMKNVIRIDAEGGAPVAMQMPQMQVAQAEQAEAPSQAAGEKPKQNFFTFEKGVGSKPIDSDQISQIAQQIQQQQQAAPAPQAASAGMAKYQAAQVQDSKEKGFPNGLDDTDESSQSSNATIEKGGNDE